MTLISAATAGAAAFADNVGRLLGIKKAFGPAIELVALNVVEEKFDIIELRKTWLKEGEEEIDTLGWFPVLDVMVKNNSNEKVALTSLDFEIINVAFGPPLSTTARCKRLAPTWYYNLLLVGDEKIGDVRRVDVAQEVDSKDLDRFIITIGWDFRRLERTPRPQSVTFEFDLSLHSDEGSIALGPRKVTVTTTPCRFTQPEPLTEVARPKPD